MAERSDATGLNTGEKEIMGVLDLRAAASVALFWIKV